MFGQLIFQTKDGAQLYAKKDEHDNITKFYSADWPKIKSALNEDLKSDNLADRLLAGDLLATIEELPGEWIEG